MSASTMSAPARASASAVPRPMPLAPPVMTATSPDRFTQCQVHVSEGRTVSASTASVSTSARS